MKIPYSLKILFSILFPLVAIFLSLYIPYLEWKANRREHPDLSKQIMEFKDNLTPDLLNSYDISYIKFPEGITDLDFDKFVQALKMSKKGGHSHPVYYSHVILTEKKEGEHFKIEIDFGKEIHNRWIGVAISICC
ncbi:MAG: hypothetical protein J6X67_07720 [Treponema sp.]|nr:hypothetical protein [Treponema sp.]